MNAPVWPNVRDVPDALTSPVRRLTTSDLRTLIDNGGYTHPLFHQSGNRVPFPGQALLLVCGGLVEQTPGLPPNILALVEITRVRFLAMVIPPLEVHVCLDVREPEQTSRSDRVLYPMTWSLVSVEGEHLRAEVLMLGSQNPASSS